jgi:diaminopimelate epimerase
MTRLAKLHATGNDFLVFDATTDSEPPSFGAESVAALCDRHLGVGADGFIVLLPGDEEVDCSMELVNADGQPAEISGNGLRCLAWVAVRAGFGDGKRLVVGTGAGVRTLDVELDVSGDVAAATADMGPVTFEPAAIPIDAPSAFDLETRYHGVTYHGDAVGTGNPHLVLIVDDPASARVTQHGPHLEQDERFPNGVNVEFISPGPERDAITMRVWERGVGETLSCGTGACAAAAVAHRRGLVADDRIVVHVPGGDLTVELGESVRLGGPVVHVFDVDLDVGGLVGGSTS